MARLTVSHTVTAWSSAKTEVRTRDVDLGEIDDIDADRVERPRVVQEPLGDRRPEPASRVLATMTTSCVLTRSTAANPGPTWTSPALLPRTRHVAER